MNLQYKCSTINSYIGGALEIIPKKYSGESTVISMRISKAMLADIDKLAAETGRTRNELMALGLEFALKHIEIIND